MGAVAVLPVISVTLPEHLTAQLGLVLAVGRVVKAAAEVLATVALTVYRLVVLLIFPAAVGEKVVFAVAAVAADSLPLLQWVEVILLQLQLAVVAGGLCMALP
jgi:hypothetical protein